MRRRAFLTAAGGALAATAGCSAVASRLPWRTPEVEHEAEMNGYVGQGFRPTVVVTGEVENVGEAFIPRLVVNCVLTSRGEPVARRQRRLESLDPGEAQLFHFVFDLSREGVREVDSFHVSTEFPGRA